MTQYDSPQVRFIQYCNQQFGAGTVIGCSIQNASDQNLANEIQYGPGVPVATQNNCVTAATTGAAAWGGWAPLPVPDYATFTFACLTDPSAPQYPIAILACLALANPMLSYAQRKTLASACATWIQNAYPAQASNIITAIEAYATTYNLPLT